MSHPAGLLRLTSPQQELLRWLALTAMLVDHVGALFFTPDVAFPLRAVGRIAWPLFALLLAYNVAVRGVDPRRYLFRLALFAAISQLPHTLAFGWKGISIMGTLFLAALLLHVLVNQLASASTAIAVAAVLIGGNFVEYGLPGIALVALLWWALREGGPLRLLGALLAIALVNAPSPLWPYGLLAVPVAMLVARLPLGVTRSGLAPWIFYPAHLLALVFIREVLRW